MFKKLAGFGIIGAISTLFSMLLMYVLHNKLHIHYQVSYVISYLIPLVSSFVLNSIFVFKTQKSTRNLLVYFSIYLSSMFSGMLILALLKLRISLDETLLSYMTLPFTTAQNFILSHVCLKKNEV
jgi:putative flippase GtrA